MLTDENTARGRDLARALSADPQIAIVRLIAGTTLVDAVADAEPDLLIVDMARPDRDALDGLRQISASAPRPVVLFVDKDDPDFMEEAIASGVCSYHVGGLAPADMRPILRAAVALFRRYQLAADGWRAAEAQLAERQVIERAKASLIRERRIGEPEAYRWLRGQAMQRGERIVDAAARMLREREEKA